MAQQQKVIKNPRKNTPKNEEIKTKDLSQKKEELKKNMKDVIDKIDDVLEKNAEEFVKNYVQKSGQ